MTEITITKRQRSYTLFLLVLVFTSSHVGRQNVAILQQPVKDDFLISNTQPELLTGVMFTAAVNLFVLNIIGPGLGPLTVGAVSGSMAAHTDINSIRYGLLATLLLIAWGASHQWHIGQLLNRPPRTAG